MENKTICVNNYVPYYPINKDNLHDTLLREKYQKINKNKKEYFRNIELVNFDIINNRCKGNLLQNSVKFYQTIHKENLQCAKEEDQDDFISEAIEAKRKDIYIEKNLIIEHFQLTPEQIRFKQRNKILFSSMHGKKHAKEYSSLISLYSHLKINI